MSECTKSSPDDYKTFCDFFTRELKDGVHKIDNKKNSIISSCDGKILEFGKVAKEHLYKKGEFVDE